MTTMAMTFVGRRWMIVVAGVLVALSAFYLSVALASVGDAERPLRDGALPIAAVSAPVVMTVAATAVATPVAKAMATPVAKAAAKAVATPVAGWTVNVNAADEAMLAKTPGIGKKGAAAIVAYRARHPFHSTEDLREVEGFSTARCRKLKEHIAVDGPALVGTLPVRHRSAKHAMT